MQEHQWPKIEITAFPKQKKLPEIKVTHLGGLISIENLPEDRSLVGDLGIQIAGDGRIWICINGVAFMRFKPLSKEDLEKAGSKSMQPKK